MIRCICPECGREWSVPVDATSHDNALFSCYRCNGKRESANNETIEQRLTLSDQQPEPDNSPTTTKCRNCGVAMTVPSDHADRVLCQQCDPDIVTLLESVPETWTERQKKQYESYLANPMD